MPLFLSFILVFFLQGSDATAVKIVDKRNASDTSTKDKPSPFLVFVRSLLSTVKAESEEKGSKKQKTS
jgi:hypothetical protein